MGLIYSAFDNQFKRQSVLKVLHSRAQNDPESVARFAEEARITGNLEHPNIVPVSDFGVIGDNQIFFSMKYIEGESLEDVLLRLRAGDSEYTARYSVYTLLTIFRKMCDACAFAHSKGILHRDIKPENIMVGKFGEVLLVDWGLAKPEDRNGQHTAHEVVSRLEDVEYASVTRTINGMIKGTLQFMSPEQAYGEMESIDQRTDIFLLGATLYAIATLHPPYEALGAKALVDKAEQCDFVDPSVKAPERQIPEELCNVIRRAMESDPDDRYQTVVELCTDIDYLLEGRTICERLKFGAGEILMNEGKLGREAYVIAGGRVQVFKMIGDQEVPLAELSAGDCVGEMALISDTPRSASVVALENTECIVINHEIMKRSVEKLPPWMAQTVQTLVGRLRAVSGNVHPLMTMDCTYHVMNQLRLLYPLLAQRTVDAATGCRRIVVSRTDAIHEIAQNLSLPSSRVETVLSKLVETGLIRELHENQIDLPNFPTYCEYVEFVGRQDGLVSAIPSDQTPVFFVSESDTILSLHDNSAPVDDSDLHEIVPEPISRDGSDRSDSFAEMHMAMKEA